MIKDNVEKVRDVINGICTDKTEKPLLVGVTKNRTVEQIKELTQCGVKDLGENRVQELLEKYPHFDGDIRWHMIGTLQKNKVKYLIGKVFLIHSVDSVELLKEINRQSEKNGLVTNVLLELNISGELSKHGFEAGNVKGVIEIASEMKSINVVGLMCMAPADADEEALTIIFNEISNIFNGLMQETEKYDNIAMKYLSMGMSRDFETAIKCGSNMIRLGTILFT